MYFLYYLTSNLDFFFLSPLVNFLTNGFAISLLIIIHGSPDSFSLFHPTKDFGICSQSLSLFSWLYYLNDSPIHWPSVLYNSFPEMVIFPKWVLMTSFNNDIINLAHNCHLHQHMQFIDFTTLYVSIYIDSLVLVLFIVYFNYI